MELIAGFILFFKFLLTSSFFPSFLPKLFSAFCCIRLNYRGSIFFAFSKNAVEKIWNVKVAKVCTVKLPKKNKLFARKQFVSPGKRKAIITLKKGYKIELPGMLETMGASESLKAAENSK